MKKTIFSEENRLLLDLLKAARSDAGITQEQLAKSLHVTQSFVSKCERGERRIDVAELRAWCKALGISLVDVVTRFDQLAEKHE